MNRNAANDGTIKATILRLIHDMPHSQERSILEMNLIWQQVVGLSVASRATICSIGSDHLIIQTDSTELMNALMGAQKYLLQRLRSLTVNALSIRKLHFKVKFDALSSANRDSSTAQKDAQMTDQDDPVIHILNDMPDLELREIIARAYSSYPKRQNAGDDTDLNPASD